MSDCIARLFSGGAEHRLAASDPLFHSGDRVGHMFLVIDGEIGLSRQTSMGTALRVQTARPGQVLAEASAYSDVYHCDARANAESTVSCISVGTFRSRLNRDQSASDAWAAHLALAVQSARMGAEIRTLRTVAERLDTWLGEKGKLPEKGAWTDLAAELGVSREALYRELGKRRRRKGLSDILCLRPVSVTG
ncbi:Crp/Fnr family transcriptional regulator [Chelativorans intermedius]|uniref:Crp/Fnr family transcriptional regulator n=1 Tax=Chelativorans intermedius TaxID=515947 RepID=A0ABV6DBX3_9HYPH|nr:Crp/Fnr family transcriptional regulator [Chelativorans intermedius]MCT9000350.1 Crp/Fnr family transcriptional regulator [Chelativorans intermedius]